MIMKLFAVLIANLGEETLREIVKEILREISINRKGGDIKEASAELRQIVNELAIEEITVEEKNTALADAGRTYNRRLREPRR